MTAIPVCAAVIVDCGKILLATRRPGGDLAGRWEFPGGKVRDGERLDECVARELREELALEVQQPEFLFSLCYDYPGKQVELNFMLCRPSAGAAPCPQEGQECAWFSLAECTGLALAPADAQMVAEHYAELAALLEAPPPESVRRPRLPDWLRTPFVGGEQRLAMQAMLKRGALHTVCDSAKCPNRCECWRRHTATFMILGGNCTRACRFCAVSHGRPEAVDPEEPERIAESVAKLGLRHAVVTCVSRDDLPDGGAAAMAATVRAIHAHCPQTRVEALVSDYNGDTAAQQTVLAAAPAVFGHNIETVERLTPAVRSVATYRRSLSFLRYAADHSAPGTVIKSGLMLGLGESDEEVREALRDLRGCGVSVVTMGQYLQPTRRQLPVARFVPPGEFSQWARYAEQELGFRKAVCGPLVRSSYHAAEAL